MTADRQVLEGARRALAKWGPQQVTIERIAREAGLSRATLHRRGITREAVLGALAAEAVEQYRAALWPALTATGSGRERLHQALTAICEVLEANLGLLQALQAQSDAIFHQDPGEDEEVLAEVPFTEPLERLLRDGQADGTLRAVDVAETATLLLNQIGWTYPHLRLGHRWRPERARRALVELAMRGLAT